MTSANNNARPANNVRAAARAFTLLELMLVIALIAIMFVAMTPLMTASMREKKLRAAAQDIEEMVRTQRSNAQNDGHRRVLEIRPRGFFNRTAKSDQNQVLAAPGGTEFYVRYPGAKWEKPLTQTWEFSPIGMVTPLSVRLENGSAWIEVDFDILTGRVAEERYAF